MTAEADHAEIQRLRDRVHQIYSTQSAILLKVAALEEWRREHTREAERVYRRVDRLALDADTAKAVADALKGRARVELTWAQRIAGVTVFVLTVSDFLRAYWH